MWETCSVDLTVRLPRDLAEEVAEVQKSDPELLSRIIRYGLTRRSIYRHLQDAPHLVHEPRDGIQGGSPPVV